MKIGISALTSVFLIFACIQLAHSSSALPCSKSRILVSFEKWATPSLKEWKAEIRACIPDYFVATSRTSYDPISNFSFLRSSFGINLHNAWNMITGDPNVIVGMTDMGIDLSNQQLIHSIWVNSGEDLDQDRIINDPDDINGVDDDGNGYIDGFVGWNSYYNVSAEQWTDPFFSHNRFGPSTASYRAVFIDVADLESSNSNTLRTDGYLGIESVTNSDFTIPFSHGLSSLIATSSNLYVNQALRGLVTLRFDEAGSATITDSVMAPLGGTIPAQEYIREMTIAGSKLYTYRGTTIHAWDLAEPDHPQPVSIENDFEHVLTYAVSSLDDTVLIAGVNQDPMLNTIPILQVVDFTNPSRPVLIGSANSNRSHDAIQIMPGNPRFVATSPFTCVYDISDPTAPTVVDSLDDVNVSGARVFGEWLVGQDDNTEILALWSVNNEGKLVRGEDIDQTVGVVNFDAQENYLAAVIALPEDGHELRIFTLADGVPELVRQASIPDAPYYPVAVSALRSIILSQDSLHVFMNSEESSIRTSDPSIALPHHVALSAAWPNPFNAQTNISFVLPERVNLRLTVYDLLGRQVALLGQGSFPAGTHRVSWSADGLSSGSYFIRMETGSEVLVRRVTLVR
ncbi:MAG: T9SS type A sorting domain-containing protein [bacterium]